MTTALIRCADCGRLVRRSEPLWDADGPHGPKCGAARGLRHGRRIRARKPKTGAGEQPTLFDSPETDAEINKEGSMTEANPPHHLQVTRTARGFAGLPPIPSEYGGEVSLSESSAADGPHVWLRAVAPVNLNDPTGPTHEVPIHLTAENAWMLADQLRHLVQHHYQGDARPEAVDRG